MVPLQHFLRRKNELDKSLCERSSKKSQFKATAKDFELNFKKSFKALKK